jgi:hypothetical protein
VLYRYNTSIASAIQFNYQIENSTFPRVNIRLNLPLIYSQFLINNNVLCSVLPLISIAPEQVGNLQDTLSFVFTTSIRRLWIQDYVRFTYTAINDSVTPAEVSVIMDNQLILNNGLILEANTNNLPAVSTLENRSEFTFSSTVEVSAIKLPVIDEREFTFTKTIDVQVNEKLIPIEDSSEFTYTTKIDREDELEGTPWLPTYNAYVPVTIPKENVQQDYDNFVVAIRMEDIPFEDFVSEFGTDNTFDFSSEPRSHILKGARVKQKIGGELPTFALGAVFYDNGLNKEGKIYFLAPNLSTTEDNEFFINFWSEQVTTNPNPKQVFQDYYWVSLHQTFGDNIIAQDFTWDENFAPSGLTNQWTSNNRRIETNTINVNSNEVTLQFIQEKTDQDNVANFSNLGVTSNAVVKTVEDVDENADEFKITDWENFFSAGDEVYVGYEGGSNADGTIYNANSGINGNTANFMIENMTSYGVDANDPDFEPDPLTQRYGIQKVDKDWFKLFTTKIENGIPTIYFFDIAFLNVNLYNGETKIAINFDTQRPEDELGAVLKDHRVRRDDGAYFADVLTDNSFNGLENQQGSKQINQVQDGKLEVLFPALEEPSFIKLASYKKSKERIEDEIINDLDPDEFYTVGNSKVVTIYNVEFTFTTTINKTGITIT